MSSIDLLTTVFGENELVKKYHNYFRPAAKVLVGSAKKELSECSNAKVESIHVSLNMEDAASANITVTDIYDLQTRSIESSVKDILCLGNTIVIKMGYDSELQDVFNGFIYEISTQFGDIPTMQITAMDVKRLMLDNTREHYVWEQKKRSEILELIVKDYEKLGLKVCLDAPGPGDKPEAELLSPLVQKGNDLRMIKQLCKALNKKFIVLGKKAYFTNKDEKKAIAVLNWGRELISLSQNAAYVDTVIKVRGNLKDSTVKSEQEKKVRLEPTNMRVLKDGAVKVTVMTDISNISELSERAEEEMDAENERRYSGNASCIGIPVLIPGRYVQIKGLDSDIDGNYYLKSVNHSLGTDGFTTDFTFGGKK